MTDIDKNIQARIEAITLEEWFKVVDSMYDKWLVLVPRTDVMYFLRSWDKVYEATCEFYKTNYMISWGMSVQILPENKLTKWGYYDGWWPTVRACIEQGLEADLRTALNI